MPTIFSHPAPVFVLAAVLGTRAVPWRLFLFGAMCAALPDADVMSFRLGISDAHGLGHRDFSPSLLCALLLGGAGALLSPWLRCKRLTGFFAAASHILLDATTNGGLGVAAFWPWDQGRYFLSWRPLKVSPLSSKIFSASGGWTCCSPSCAGSGRPA